MKKVLFGNEAIARGAYEAGCHVAAAYPGTPSTEILETIASDYPEIKSQWSPNEKTALEVAGGASVAGARALAAMKHVGLNVAADPLFTFSYMGVSGGLVIVNADDPGAWSSQNEQDNRHLARASKTPMLEPADLNEAKEFTRMAFDISEKFDVPVLIRSVTRLSHSQGLVELGERKEVPVREFVRNPQKYVMVPGHARPRHKFKEEVQIPALKEFSETSGFNKIIKRSPKRGIVASGIAYQYVMEVCPDDSVLKIGMPWPLPEKMIREFASQVEELYVVEELDPYLEDAIKAMGIKVKGGKNIIPIVGELSTEIVNAALNNVEFKPAVPLYDAAKTPARPPLLCKGCSHTFVFDVLKKLDLNVIGDIGCYTLGVLPPYEMMHTQACMGASISMHLGIEKAHGRELIKKTVAMIGDSTFVHTGISSLIDLVYNKGTGTVMILDNRITAMTGHQEHPGTGKTISGDPTFELDLEVVVKACGVKRVVTLDPKDTELLEKTILEEIEADEPSVIIAKRKCILVK